jgi:hypothetical protein
MPPLAFEYQSAFSEYKPFEEHKLRPWRELNDQASKAGGHIGIFGGFAPPEQTAPDRPALKTDAAGQPPTNLPAPTCGCTKTGAFVSPQIKGLVPTSTSATVTTTANQLTLRRNADNHVIINGATSVSAFGFSPNGKFFVLVTSLSGSASLTLYSVERAAPVGARDVPEETEEHAHPLGRRVLGEGGVEEGGVVAVAAAAVAAGGCPLGAVTHADHLADRARDDESLGSVLQLGEPAH